MSDRMGMSEYIIYIYVMQIECQNICHIECQLGLLEESMFFGGWACSSVAYILHLHIDIHITTYTFTFPYTYAYTDTYTDKYEYIYIYVYVP